MSPCEVFERGEEVSRAEPLRRRAHEDDQPLLPRGRRTEVRSPALHLPTRAPDGPRRRSPEPPPVYRGADEGDEDVLREQTEAGGESAGQRDQDHDGGGDITEH